MVYKSFNALVNLLIKMFFIINIYSCNLLIIKQLISQDISILFAIVSSIVEYVIVKNIIFKINCPLRKLSNFKIKPILFFGIIPFLIKIIIIHCFFIELNGDIYVYVNNARELLKNGVVETYASYSWDFPHLFWFACLLVPGVIFNTKFVYVYVSILQCISYLVLYESLKNIFKENIFCREICFTTVLIYAYLPSQLFSCLTPTHEIGFNVIFILVIYSLSKKQRKMFTVIITSICLFCMKLVNPMGMVVLIAYVIQIILNPHKEKLLINIAIIAIIFSILGPTSKAIQAGCIDVSEEPVKYPFIWSVYLGGNYNTEGRYNQEDRDAIDNLTIEKFGDSYSLSQKQDLIVQQTVYRWSELVKTHQILKHIYNKIKNVWSGTHYSIEYVSVFSKVNRAFFMMMMLFNNLIYILMMHLALVGFSNYKKDENELMFFKTCVIGICIILIFTEVMNKYNLTAIVPVSILLGTYISVLFANKNMSI